MCGNDGLRHFDGTRVAVDVVRMTVRVDHVRDHHPLIGGACNKRFRRVGGIDQDGALRGAIAEEIAEVAIATSADLFEDKLHDMDCNGGRPAGKGGCLSGSDQPPPGGVHRAARLKTRLATVAGWNWLA